jgi:primosomal protein N' (replication factor Y)
MAGSLVRVALPVPVSRAFDYRTDAVAAASDVGRVVRLRFAGRKLHGVIVELPNETPLEDSEILSIDSYADDVPPVATDVLALSRFAADYYQFPLGMALLHAVPPRGRKPTAGRRNAPNAYRATPEGLAALTALAPRARVQREVAAPLLEGRVVEREALSGRAPAAASLVRRWETAGWIAPAEPEWPAADALASLPPLTAAQQEACAAIIAAAGSFAPFVLHGITGSGKTEVYLAAAAAVIRQGGQVLMLVPEINLTPQLTERVRRALPFARIALLHSHVADAERLAAWRDAATGSAQLVLGTRLAVFAPLPSLGLVVVDEEHDLSYKQQDGLRYHARDLAVYRARIRQVPVVLGSATPALETLWHAANGRYRLLALPERAGGGALPTVRLVRQRAEGLVGPLAPPLVVAIEERLARREQALVFINRRGFAPSMLCAECGWAAACDRCSARLVLHLADRRLRCHHCGYEEPVRMRCPECGNQDLLPLGFGTQRLEATLRERFPGARIARVDADSTRRRGSWARVREAILAGDVDVLVGTQMLGKGHDFPKLTLVGILGADNALYSADFRATERLHAQLVQVAGRAGRAEYPGEVLIQTDFPEHPLYRALVTHDSAPLIEALLAERRQLNLPPFARLALLRAEARERSAVERFLGRAHDDALRLVAEHPGVRVSAPVAARMARKAGFERAHLLFQSATPSALQHMLSALREHLGAQSTRSVRWSIDVDPQGVD